MTKRGYEVLKAYNGKEGIAKLENDSVDIIFADLILQKIDDRQFFKFVRDKYNGSHFPLVALSGSMIEQLGQLDEIWADYFIAKGPTDLLAVKLNEFMAELETQSTLPPSEKKVLAAGNVYPRRDAMELLNSLHFHQAVIESAAVGIIIVDDDTRIINANRSALDIVGLSSVKGLNHPVAELFAADERAELVSGLKQVRKQPELKKHSSFATLRSQIVGTSISAITLSDGVVGWVIVLEPAWQADPAASLS